MNSNECIGFALYDWDGEIGYAQFHELALDFFAANGAAPDVGGISTESGKSREIGRRRIAKQLSNREYEHAISLDLYHTLPDYAQLVFGWDVNATLMTDKDRTLSLCCDRTLAGLDLDYFEPLLDHLAKNVQLKYGIGFFRAFNFGPALYVDGMVAGYGYTKEDHVHTDRIGAWFRERINQRRHLSGYLRDVYPLNVLSEKHLSALVGGIQLADWIRGADGRGTLRELADGAWLWRLPMTQVDAVRQNLERAGLLIAYLPRAS